MEKTITIACPNETKTGITYKMEGSINGISSKLLEVVAVDSSCPACGDTKVGEKHTIRLR